MLLINTHREICNIIPQHLIGRRLRRDPSC
jgi:hypothetical protein